MIRFECICSNARTNCTKYFQMVRSGIRRLLFLKCYKDIEKNKTYDLKKIVDVNNERNSYHHANLKELQCY